MCFACNSVDEFSAFFHDGEVCGEVDVKHVVETASAECCNHLAFNVGAHRHTKFFAEAYAD